MTRDESKKEFWQVSRDGYSGVFERAFNIKFNEVIKMPYYGSEFDKFIDKIYDNFEQRIKELEAPKTCDGCKFNRFGNDSLGVAVECTGSNSNCARQWYKDYYEPKEK